MIRPSRWVVTVWLARSRRRVCETVSLLRSTATARSETLIGPAARMQSKSRSRVGSPRRAKRSAQARMEPGSARLSIASQTLSFSMIRRLARLRGNQVHGAQSARPARISHRLISVDRRSRVVLACCYPGCIRSGVQPSEVRCEPGTVPQRSSLLLVRRTSPVAWLGRRRDWPSEQRAGAFGAREGDRIRWFSDR